MQNEEDWGGNIFAEDSRIDEDERDIARVDDDLARLAKVDGDMRARIRLHLSDPPIGAVGMSDEHSGLEDSVEVTHDDPPLAQTMTAQDLDLTGLIGSRICHDLISPIGAIGNGVELLEMSAEAPPGPAELGLIADSVKNATAKMQLFRIAFGLTRGAQTYTAATLGQILNDYTAEGRLSFACDFTEPATRPEAQFLLRLALCIESAQTIGAQARISQTSDAWTITATGTRFRHDNSLWKILTGGAPDPALHPADVQFPLAAASLEKMGIALTYAVSETEITINAPRSAAG